MAGIAEASAPDLEISLAWHVEGSGMLGGQLRARNVSGRPVRLAGKPELQPLDGVDGVPLGAACIVTAEMRHPNYVGLAAGDQAVSALHWAGWDGRPANGDWAVTLPGGASRVRATGPRQPERRGPATNLSSTWWELSPAD